MVYDMFNVGDEDGAAVIKEFSKDMENSQLI